MQQEKWVWGPLRLIIGMLQMALAVSAAVRVLLAGLDEMAWILIGAATVSTLLSRVLYGGGGVPRPSQLETRQDETERPRPQ